MKTVIVIQARRESTRLPDKVLLDLAAVSKVAARFVDNSLRELKFGSRSESATLKAANP